MIFSNIIEMMTMIAQTAATAHVGVRSSSLLSPPPPPAIRIQLLNCWEEKVRDGDD